MKIVIISDTHGEHQSLKIPKCDVIVHCGDITPLGKEHSIKEFLSWFSSLDQCKYKIFISGNHDFLFERARVYAKELIPENIIYLEDSMVEIEGKKFYGTPVQIAFHNWAFNRTEEELSEYWKKIPEGVDVLITHGPPYNVLDKTHWGGIHTGSPSLFEEVTNRIKPKIHCFGHIHEDYGIEEINGITFVNASNLNLEYEVSNEPIVLEI
jgi:Icc-related predicted phosphoesterase